MNGAFAIMTPEWVAAWLLPYIRLQTCLIAMPGWGDRIVPTRIRVALALALTPLAHDLARVPSELTYGPDPVWGTGLGIATMIEAVTGLSLGFLVRIAAHALGMATSAIAATTSLSQLVGGPSEAAPHPVGNLFDLAGLALLMSLGYPLFFMDYIAAGYQMLPVMQLPDAELLGMAGIAAVMRAFALAMTLAAPFILGGLLYQCLLGILSRVMPSLLVVFIGAPAALMLALAGIALLAPAILAIWTDSILDLRLPGLLP